MVRHAITRRVASTIGRCELTFLERSPVEYRRAQAQHDAYCEVLEAAGLTVTVLEADDRFPDCCFIEDAAIVFDELAVMTRCAAASRRGEQTAVRAALAPHRPIVEIHAPATIDGGDVVQMDRTILVGRSGRTDDAGIAALASAIAAFGYDVIPVDVQGSLHLKSACTAIDDETLIVNPAWLDTEPLARWRLIPVPPEEPYAADVLRLDDRVIMHSGHPSTRALVEALGITVMTTDVSEFLKAEGAVTCLSLLLRSAGLKSSPALRAPRRT